MADLFAAHCILLVIELQGGEFDGCDVLVIQRCSGTGVDGAGQGDVSGAEGEGLGAGFGRWGVEVLRRTQEPPESNDDQIDDNLVEGTLDGVLGVEDREPAEDGDVDWVGSRGRVVFVGHGFEESSEYGMVLSCDRVDSGIRLTQVGDPLADGREGGATVEDRTDLLFCPNMR